MRQMLILAAFLLLGALHAHAQTDAERAVVRSVIAQQIEAFQRDDAEGAYQFAAPAIKAMFPTPEIFMNMVRLGYRPVYRPRSFAFEALRQDDGHWLQPVRIIGPEGQAVVAVYVMERQPNGDWRIAGVQLVAAGDQAA